MPIADMSASWLFYMIVDTHELGHLLLTDGDCTAEWERKAVSPEGQGGRDWPLAKVPSWGRIYSSIPHVPRVSALFSGSCRI